MVGSGNGWHTCVLGAMALLLVFGCAKSKESCERCLDGGEDAGVDVGFPDAPCAPPRLECVGGPCCNDTAEAILEPDCTQRCPAGFSEPSACMIDPAARCSPAWYSCGSNDQCVVATRCCSACRELRIDEVDGANRELLDLHYDATCPDDIACEPCPVDSQPRPAPSIQATCVENVCELFDVRTDPISACSRDDQCVLRVAQCCDCGGDTRPEALIALRPDGIRNYLDRVCPVDATCGGCAPIYPDTVEAFCDDDGHCNVREVAP